jgi:leucyl-tRNA synthetase
MTITRSRQTRYVPGNFEASWQLRWEEEGLYRAEDDSPRPKYYLLDFFPYPSGEGLHVGHSKQYIATDTASRFLRMRGLNVMHPMGWDAFGLPAENDAILMQIPPAENTARNIANFKRQLQLQGIGYDWSREINSCQPDFYRWTQWLFLLMLRRGLAYRAKGSQWWCPKCKTILANEQVENGYCWRHSDQLVEKKELEQWYFRITDYAEELLADLDGLDWPERIILMQRHWIGKSVGAEISFTAIAPDGSEHPISVFTTRPDTVFGATFMVLSPEHPLVPVLTPLDQRARVVQYQQTASRESEIERLSTDREKTGVPTGAYAINPYTHELIPIWIADYVLMTYGTGAIMAVPAGDERDFEFANKYSLPIVRVVQGPPDSHGADACYSGHGTLVNSGEFSGLSSEDGKVRIIADLEARGIGNGAVNFRMRDWLVSRQRYWGAPIPIVYCPDCGAVPVPEDELPVLLPLMEKWEPGDDGRSPLANNPDFVNTTCPNCGGAGRRETDTLDTFVDSSWYHYRYTSPHDSNHAFDPARVAYWCPMDLYVGGAEHAIMHLLYFRFFCKVLADTGLLNFREPAPRLRNQGTLHAPDGRRMSKSKHNSITPDSVVTEYGADTLRGYILFMGPFDGDAIWDPKGINGVHRWLGRVWGLAQPVSRVPLDQPSASVELERAVNKTIKRVTEDMIRYQFNTSISALMELTNMMHRLRNDLEGSAAWKFALDRLLVMMAPIAPHVTEELWHRHGHEESVHRVKWPEFDEAMTIDELVTVVVQVNGKLRDRLEMARGAEPASVRQLALASPRVQPFVRGRRIVKVIEISDKLVNIVVE